MIDQLELFEGIPLPHDAVMNLLQHYKRPNDKIGELVKSGRLVPVKKGLYYVSTHSNYKPEPGLIANHLYGPSYVSAHSAMALHGLIPELVRETTSVTTRRSRKFNTRVGVFSYRTLPLPYYAFGIDIKQFDPKQVALIASAEKSVCDTIVLSPGLILRSVKQTLAFLLENLRIDEFRLRELNGALIEEWSIRSPKSESLKFTAKCIEFLRK